MLTQRLSVSRKFLVTHGCYFPYLVIFGAVARESLYMPHDPGNAPHRAIIQNNHDLGLEPASVANNVSALNALKKILGS